jgi:hypothetical protein
VEPHPHAGAGPVQGLDRDRAVDETGGQIAVFGRIGSRPFNAAEMAKLYLRPDSQVWTVSDQGVPGDYVPRAQKGKK